MHPSREAGQRRAANELNVLGRKGEDAEHRLRLKANERLLLNVERTLQATEVEVDSHAQGVYRILGRRTEGLPFRREHRKSEMAQPRRSPVNTRSALFLAASRLTRHPAVTCFASAPALAAYCLLHGVRGHELDIDGSNLAQYRHFEIGD